MSRRISMVLRHRPESAGLTLDANGWVPVADLLAALGITRGELDVIVEHNDKSRFAVARRDDGVECIRAGMAADGHVFHRSANGVWLTSAVPPAYLSTKGANQQGG